METILQSECVHDVAMTFTAPVPYMQGLGTNDRVLVRVMVSRCEVDMVQIKKTFYQKYHKTLGSFIKVQCTYTSCIYAVLVSSSFRHFTQKCVEILNFIGGYWTS